MQRDQRLHRQSCTQWQTNYAERKLYTVAWKHKTQQMYKVCSPTISCAGSRHNMPPPPASWQGAGDLLTLKVVYELRVTWSTSVPILVKVKRSKVNLQGRGHIVAAFRTACYLHIAEEKLHRMFCWLPFTASVSCSGCSLPFLWCYFGLLSYRPGLLVCWQLAAKMSRSSGRSGSHTLLSTILA